MGNIYSYFFPEEIFFDSKNQENEVREVLPQTSPLLDMPIEVFRKILEKLSLGEIQTVRKVCRDLRNFIDNSDVYVKRIPNLTILVDVESISFFSDDYDFSVLYRKKDNGCIVGCETFLENMDVLDAAMMDIEPILKNPWTEFSCLKITTSASYVKGQKNLTKFLEFLENVLKSRPRPLRTKELFMRPGFQSDVLKVLPYLQPKNLTKIGFRRFREKGNLNVDEVMKLEQWREAEEVFSERSPDLKTFHESFGHFKTIELRNFDFPKEGWSIFRETMILHPNIELIVILFHNGNVGLPFEDAYINEENIMIWFFELVEWKEYVKIYLMPDLIIFERIGLFEIPDGVSIFS